MTDTFSIKFDGLGAEKVFSEVGLLGFSPSLKSRFPENKRFYPEAADSKLGADDLVDE